MTDHETPPLRPEPPPPPPPSTELRIALAIERLADELAATREVLQTLPDRRDLVESFVAAALVLSPNPHTPEELAVGVRRVSDAVWEAIHGAQPSAPPVKGGSNRG